MRRHLLVLALALAAPGSARAADLLAPVPLPVSVAPAPAPVSPPAATPAPVPAAAPSRSKLSDDDAGDPAEARAEEPAGEQAAQVAGNRHFGILYGAGPAVLALDLEIGHFYGFVSAPLALDIFDNADLAMGALGLGATFRLPHDSRWSFDVYAFGIPAQNTGLGWNKPRVMLTFGVGAGFHFTSQKGFTFGVKVPLLGSSVSLDGYDFNDAGDRALSFYMNSVLSLPIAAFGYRF